MPPSTTVRADGHPRPLMPPVRVAHVDDVDEQRCLVVANGRAVLVRRGGVVRAYENRCLHTGASLEGAVVRDDVLMCPNHFWRYDVTDGRLLSGGVGDLPGYPVRIDPDGAVWVDLPEPPGGSLRDQLLHHARSWERDG